MEKIEPLPITKTPGLDIPFLFDSYGDLIRDLGAMDGLAAAQTVACMHFIDNAAEQEDQQKFARELSAQYQVWTHFVDFQRVPPHLNQLLIVGTHQQAEAFLDKFRREQLQMGRKWRAKDDGEPQLKYTLSCLDGGFNKNYIRVRKERCDLFEYYRIVRNAFVHSSIDRDRVQREFESVSQWRPLVEEEFGLEAPNPVADVTFADHMLFTRITKYLATDLCRLGPPITSKELLYFLVSDNAPKTHPLESIVMKKTDAEPYREGVRRFYRARFNYDIRENPDAWDGIVEWIGKLPNRPQRRDMGAGTIVEYARAILKNAPGEDGQSTETVDAE